MEDASTLSPARARCLTPAQLAALGAAEPGRAPEELALHLAACPSCQERLLLDGRARRRTGRAPAMPSLKRAVVMLAAVLLAMAAFFYSLSRLSFTVR